MKKVIIAGGTGFLGDLLKNHFLQNKYAVTILSRSSKHTSHNFKQVLWDGVTLDNWVDELEDTTLLINLCGKSVDCRYTSNNKLKILNSRIDSTKVLGQAILTLKNPPTLWINSSSATIYPHSVITFNTEKNKTGKGFSVDICKKWEESFFTSITPTTRKVAIRTSMVFGNEGSVYKKLKSLTLMGLGGTQGDGNQYISWIHQKDFINAIEFILQNKELDGCINVCAPDPIPNAIFFDLLRKSLTVKLHFPIKTWMVYLGAFFMQTEAELVLKSRKVIPEKLIDTGFKFEFPTIKLALKELNQDPLR